MSPHTNRQLLTDTAAVSPPEFGGPDAGPDEGGRPLSTRRGRTFRSRVLAWTIPLLSAAAVAAVVIGVSVAVWLTNARAATVQVVGTRGAAATSSCLPWRPQSWLFHRLLPPGALACLVVDAGEDRCAAGTPETIP